ncbi:MAG: stage II sporulation protein M [Flavobacteriales bacterium]|nr:stage II sporulation protein M [Flavobacteriales bacterium]MCW8937682.1 stage II sporulation protein M [Flavobacteriales bacterium]MCW8967556.1 stage II sporulation protein M [Flavobacteriales bacterium]MCW8990170.1 stage II sporulation protein M [Flavobacteriales bacterium]MCW9019888.1 stage II sporulation protein M [Flavobacteriales bacterium]
MREVVFIKKNADKWKKMEQLVHQKVKITPDENADLFIQLTNDLAFAKTYYPKSTTTEYLNQLAATVHHEIYQNKKESNRRFITFWKTELPLVIKNHHKQLLIAFLIFFISGVIGWVSAKYDDSFVRLILGDAYVNMTLENIENDDPMAVYKKSKELDMFLGITINNIRVSFVAFILGLFFSFGTGFILFFNGIMLGSFQYFFAAKGLLFESFLTIWIHGTLEISAIIIAGAAGITMGNSILFPKTYPRATSFIKGAKNGIKIVVGLVPIFITAGFLEGFVTRHTEMPIYLSLFIIFGSLTFIIWYFIVYPNNIYKKYTSI